MSAQPAVFLDRDGTMIHDPGYLGRLEGLQWYPYSIDAVRLLNRAGFLVFVTTNQGGVGLGLFDESFVHAVHEAMTARG
jgi:D-glycero-D-manno-heptose 1,7-bisphosphate phosphatase